MSLDWYFNELSNAIKAKPLVVSPNSHRPIANMDRCYNVARIIHGNIHWSSFPIRLNLIAPPVEMEHWHVPYNYPRGNNVQAWLLKSFEGAISRDSDKECDWMLKQRCVAEPVARTKAEALTLWCSLTIEQTGRPEKQKLPRLSNPFGKKNKPEWKVATLWDLVPELEPDTQPSSDYVFSRYSKPLPPLPLA
jgi:hypothetical protein